MKKYQVLTALLVVALTVAAVACGAPPTPTPRPSPTLPPLPTIVPTPTRVQPTPIPPTPTRAQPPTSVPPVLPPTATPVPTRVVPPVIPTVAMSPTPVPPTAPPPPSPPTGTIIFHAKKDGIDRFYYVDPNTAAVTQFIDSGSPMDLKLENFGTNAHMGEFSPDNTKFAYAYAGAPGQINVLRIYDLNSKATRNVYSDTGISSPVWSADGKRIAFVRKSPTLWYISIVNAEGRDLGREDVKVPGLEGDQYRGGLSWSKDNLLAFAMNTTGASDIYTNYPDGKMLTNLTKHPADDTTPVWSPDGKMIAFTSTRDGFPQIYVMNADGSGLRRVRKSASHDFSPTWSPDGKWIGFASTANFATDVYIMDLNGGNVKLLANGDHPFWSR